MPKKANRPDLEHVMEGEVYWHVHETSTRKPAQSFMFFGTVAKEIEEPYLDFHAFVSNATGAICGEAEIEVDVIFPRGKTPVPK